MTIDDDAGPERLLAMAAGCEAVVRRCLDELARMEADLSALVNQACTGQPWWRDRAHPGRAGKLYIVHPSHHACPMHGSPPPGGRLRVYVGSDPARIAQAQACIARAPAWRALQQRRAALQRRLASGILYLHGFYIVLGCLPEPPDEEDKGAE